MNDRSDMEDADGDGEGVWSPDIEQCFREALLLFPPCGRRKHILQEEGGGKMYGRNELIARHIRMRTGKIRSRKQVSSHIQVLARRKAKAETGGTDSASPSSSIGVSQSRSQSDNIISSQPPNNGYYDRWDDRPIVTKKIRLVEFSAFIEYRRQVTNFGAITDPEQKSTVPGMANNPTVTSNDLQGPNMASYNYTHAPTDVDFTHSTHTAVIAPLSGNNDSYQLKQETLSCAQQQQPLNNNHLHHHLVNQENTDATDYLLKSNASSLTPSYNSSGFMRHSYVKIPHHEPSRNWTDKIERIDISQIQDKFPEIGGLEGLFQRGPPDAFYLVKFWADINSDFEYHVEDQNSYFGFSSHFETVDLFKEITCSTKACSYGLQVVEKVERIHGAFNSSNGRYSYNIGRSPMCEFMIQFIKKLTQLPQASQMNSVLENFTVLQVITSEATSEILLCLAFVFEIASAEQHNGSQYHVYKLTKD